MDLINKTGFAGDQSPLVDPCGRAADAQCDERRVSSPFAF